MEHEGVVHQPRGVVNIGPVTNARDRIRDGTPPGVMGSVIGRTNEVDKIDRAKPLCPNSNAPQDLAVAKRGRRRFVPIGHVERVRGIAEPDGRSIELGSGLPAGGLTLSL